MVAVKATLGINIPLFASVISNFGTSENEDDKLIAKMQNMLNTHVYGIKYANPTETTRKLAPFLEKMRTYIRDLRLLGSVASAIKGMVSAIVDTMGVSFINRYFDKKDLTFGVKEYLKESHSRIYQSSSILKTTKSEVLADSLGLVGSLERNTANNTRTRVWRMITKSVDYGNYVSADRNIKYPIEWRIMPVHFSFQDVKEIEELLDSFYEKLWKYKN